MTSTEFYQLLNSLYSLQRKGIKLGLSHTRRLLNFLGSPQHNFKIIHVAGTNGKGSTCVHIESILRENGYNVGLYTSPHLIKFNERIRVNGIPITNHDIVHFMDFVKNEIKKIRSTFFETTTAMALDYFNKKHIDVAVIETGLGGRLDATNIIKPYLTVMTPISMDHMEILGDTIQKIAKEKAGIIKKNIPLITAPQIQKVMNILEKKALEKNTTVILSDSPSSIKITNQGTTFSLGKHTITTPLLGCHQAINASLAISATKYFCSDIIQKKINKGLKNVVWPGRMQKISEKIYYDVAHNEDGIKRTLNTIKNLYPKCNLYGLFCIKQNKNIKNIIGVISGQFKQVFVLNDKNDLLINATELYKKLKDFGFKSTPVKSIKSGLIQINGFGDETGITLIFGSHYIAKDIFTAFEISFDSVKI